jgi:bifunctional UDP-N-acetylglucosamine pyrophosphorylase/glucosamine-1-phosphate N-acetyltransferase
VEGVVLAAGAGKRLRPVTLERSKATVPVCGRSMIERVLDSLAGAGIDDFVVVVADVNDEVAEVCRQWANGRPLHLAAQPVRNGMAGALKCAVPYLHGPFVLSACDSLVDTEQVAKLLAHHRTARPLATLALSRLPSLEAVRTTGVVALDGSKVTQIVEKPEPHEAPSDIASLPLYAFAPEVLQVLHQVPLSKRGEYELQDAIRLLIGLDGGVSGVHTAGRWQITDAADLLAINHEFLRRGEVREDGAARCVGPVHIEPGVELGEGCSVGPWAVLEAGCRVGDGATIRESVVLRDASIAAGSLVEGCVVAPEDVVD